MDTPIVDQVVDFYHTLFESIFSEVFRVQIKERLKRNIVIRQVEEAADAASQSLTRFFLNEQLSERRVRDILEGFTSLGNLLKLEDVANPNVTPEVLVDHLLNDIPSPEKVQQAGKEPVYRVALHSVIQVLMLVGPVMAEWQKLKFSSTFELPRRIVNRLNQISDQLDAIGRSGEAAADERYELSYRDYLLQRFHRVEAGTVRMTTNLDIDLRELFVMPRVLPRDSSRKREIPKDSDRIELMNLAAAREFFGARESPVRSAQPDTIKDDGITALDQVKRYPFNVIIGAPGAGKSTFLEWLQVKLASVEEELIMAGQQAIPLLLRVRQLAPQNLPHGSALIQAATASQDRAALMPPNWIDRQMKQGRVIFLLDGLDEVEPELRDKYVFPWLLDLREQFPHCRYLISSRPVGYPTGLLRQLEFAECDLADFNDAQIEEYTHHWCTAVRLARNEPASEARREGIADGDRIIEGFKHHPYIRNLARNPLMLSAICLVNYFEGGQLPKDRVVLYKMCVEGLLHNWDQRRGIHSEFGLDEKLRTCREVALAMQANDRAEYEAQKVRDVFAAVLRDSTRADRLLEHIRYRTGLLLERRPGIFAFAHLTFQEYLAARAVHEGNQLGIDAETLVREHDDGRWQEVIALFCGISPAPIARNLLVHLSEQLDTRSISTVLTEAYLSSAPELLQDSGLRESLLRRIAVAPSPKGSNLIRFPREDVQSLAYAWVGRAKTNSYTSESYQWLYSQDTQLDTKLLSKRLRNWRNMSSMQLGELIYLLHVFGSVDILTKIIEHVGLYSAPGPKFASGISYGTQAEVALLGLADRKRPKSLENWWPGIPHILRAIVSSDRFDESGTLSHSFGHLLDVIDTNSRHMDDTTYHQVALLARSAAKRLEELKSEKMHRIHFPDDEKTLNKLYLWANQLERATAKKVRRQSEPRKAGKKSEKRKPKREAP